MPKYQNYQQLFNYIERNINDILRDEVANHAREIMKDKIETEVYDAYQPTHYDRKRENGGLIADENIITDVISDYIPGSDHNLRIDNIRSDENKDVAEIVEYGVGYTWGISRDLDQEIGERPFMFETYRQMASSLSYFHAFKRGLQNRGFQVKYK